MPTFCLIHSSVQGSDGWDLLVEALNRRGYRSITPDFRSRSTAGIVPTLRDRKRWPPSWPPSPRSNI